MKKTCVLKFSSLEELALFVKKIQPRGYLINTVRLTITACLTSFERSIALDNFRAVDVTLVSV